MGLYNKLPAPRGPSGDGPDGSRGAGAAQPGSAILAHNASRAWKRILVASDEHWPPTIGTKPKPASATALEDNHMNTTLIHRHMKHTAPTALRVFLALAMVLMQLTGVLGSIAPAQAAGGSYNLNWTAADPKKIGRAHV